MNLVHKIINWEHARHKLIILILRIAIGIIILLKGIMFLSDAQYFNSLVAHSRFKAGEAFWIYYIVFAHLIGGISLIIGLFTRIAAIMQMPILLGAIIFINPGEHGFTLNGEFILSFFVLSALIYFTIKGPSNTSMDEYLKNHEL